MKHDGLSGYFTRINILSGFIVLGRRVRRLCWIKCFESEVDGRARRTPHSAFVDEEFEGEGTGESIEVRALCFYDGE